MEIRYANDGYFEALKSSGAFDKAAKETVDEACDLFFLAMDILRIEGQERVLARLAEEAAAFAEIVAQAAGSGTDGESDLEDAFTRLLAPATVLGLSGSGQSEILAEWRREALAKARANGE